MITIGVHQAAITAGTAVAEMEVEETIEEGTIVLNQVVVAEAVAVIMNGNVKIGTFCCVCILDNRKNSIDVSQMEALCS